MFGSYNKFRTKVHYHALAISSLDFVTSIIAGVVIFSVLGELKVKTGADSIEVTVSVFGKPTAVNTTFVRHYTRTW